MELRTLRNSENEYIRNLGISNVLMVTSYCHKCHLNSMRLLVMCFQTRESEFWVYSH